MLQRANSSAAPAARGLGHRGLLLRRALPVSLSSPVPVWPHSERVQDPHPKRQSYEDGNRDRIRAAWSPDSGTSTSSGSQTPRCKTSPRQEALAPFHPSPNPNQATDRSRGGLRSYPRLRKTEPCSAKHKFYLNFMPVRPRGNKSSRSLLYLALVFLSTSHSQAYFNLPALPLYGRDKPEKQLSK